ncbi:MAG TPA: MerR family transcriptional regulator [Asanoa sp.]
MFSIGYFASHGRVSVRMLHHYDAIGLLRPAYVDPATGYRSYAADQLSRLNRIVALKDLGFSLEQVRSILDDKIGVEELRGMLRLRQAELQAQIVRDTARLDQVEARLLIIEREGAMPADEVEVKSVAAVRLAELSGVAAGFEPGAITPVIGPLYEQLMSRLEAAGVTMVGPPVTWYEDAPDGEGVVVHAGAPIAADARTLGAGVDVVELPALPRAATIVHRGSMESVMPTIQALARWIEANGYRSRGYNREVYHAYGQGAPESWVTELQEPVAS